MPHSGGIPGESAVLCRRPFRRAVNTANPSEDTHLRAHRVTRTTYRTDPRRATAAPLGFG